ncbi:MAG: DUF4760 domain-containing protein [Pseudomonadota bacterium]
MPIVLDIPAVIISAVIGATVSVVVTQYTLKHRTVADRRRSTVDLIERRLLSFEREQTRTEFLELLDDPDRSLCVWAREDKRESREASIIRNLLNEYELIAIGIEQKLYDEVLYKYFWKGALLDDWEATIDFIDLVRRRTKNPEIYRQFSNLAERWSKEKNSPTPQIAN